MTPFVSYFWRIESVPIQERDTISTLIGARDKGTFDTAYTQLLQSTNPTVLGIAFDQYVYAEAETRLGIENLLAPYAARLLKRAREQLQQPLVDSVAPNGDMVHGANHASALGVLARLGDATDLSCVAQELDRSRDLSVLQAACEAANHCLSEENSSEGVFIGALLARLFMDQGQDSSVRVAALTVFINHTALNRETELIELAMHGPLEVATYAAWALACQGVQRHQKLLAQLVEGWPDDAPFPASEVREMLSELTS